MVRAGESGRRTRPQQQRFVLVYDGRFGNEWEDGGWAPRTFAAGPAAIDFSDYGGWIVSHAGVFEHVGGVVFRIKAPAEFGDFLEVRLDSAEPVRFPTVRPGPMHRRDLDDGWSEVWISMDELSPNGAPFDEIVFRAVRPVSPAPVLLDGIWLTRPMPVGDAKAR
jgi:hypothetical protein